MYTITLISSARGCLVLQQERSSFHNALLSFHNKNIKSTIWKIENDEKNKSSLLSNVQSPTNQHEFYWLK